MKKFSSDIDIDVADRTLALQLLNHVPASIISNGASKKHTTGIYFTDIPIDPFTGRASVDYEAAEELGYIKVDVLNVGLYQQVQSEQHLQDLMQQEPAWDTVYDPDFCAKLRHIVANYDTLIRFPEAVNSIPRLAMFLACIRPAKRYLIGRTWREVAESVWEKPADGGYAFKRSHGVAYAHLVAVNMNLLSQASEQE